MSITTEKKKQMTMKNPPHPGLVVLQECVEPLGLTITDAAEALGVTRNTLSELVNGKGGISPEMACGSPRFSAAPSKVGWCNRLSTTFCKCGGTE
jgi:addiction module HigA family antidote